MPTEYNVSPDDFERSSGVLAILLRPGANPFSGIVAMSEIQQVAGCPIVDFAQVEAVPCPCGEARRAFHGVPEFPGSLHVTDIHEDAEVHHHRRLTETYYFLECSPGSRMQLNDEFIDVRPGMSIVIPPGTRHRAVGRMKVLIIVVPEFDPADEWLD